MYFVADFSGLENLLTEKKQEVQYLESQKKNTLELLQSISRKDLSLPEIRIYEGEQLESLFTDMMTTIRASSLRTIRFFGSNTFEEQNASHHMHEKFRHFLEVLSEQRITIDSFFGT